MRILKGLLVGRLGVRDLREFDVSFFSIQFDREFAVSILISGNVLVN